MSLTVTQIMLLSALSNDFDETDVRSRRFSI